MIAIFPCDPLSPREVEPDFALEAQAARDAGFEIARLDHDALERGHVEQALRLIVNVAPAPVVYRGWMLRSDDYAQMTDALGERGFKPLTSANAYRSCHELPNWIDLLGAATPRSVCVSLSKSERAPESLPWPRILEAARAFGDAPLVVKDWVKSRKHDWANACFIASASNECEVRRVVSNFVTGQNESLVGGIVLRAFVELQTQSEAKPGQMPAAREERWWVQDGVAAPSPGLDGTAPGEFFASLARNVFAATGNRFFSLDLARAQNGDWLIIEIGDGQVSGLRDGTDANAFYARLYRAFTLG